MKRLPWCAEALLSFTVFVQLVLVRWLSLSTAMKTLSSKDRATLQRLDLTFISVASALAV